MITIQLSSLAELLAPRSSASYLTTLNLYDYYVLRANPMLAEAVKDQLFSVDSRPIYYWLRFLRSVECDLVQGSSFIFDAAAAAAAERRSLVILGGTIEANRDACARIRHEFGVEALGYAPDTFGPDEVREASLLLRRSHARFAFVCLGAPKQMLVGTQLVRDLGDDSDCLLIGAGGTVDFAAGRLKRAPRYLQRTCLEGLYRLLQEPSIQRVSRIAKTLKGAIQLMFDHLANSVVMKARDDNR